MVYSSPQLANYSTINTFIMNLFLNFDSLSACFHNEKNLTNDYKCGDLEANETCGKCGMIMSAILMSIHKYTQYIIFQNTNNLL